ncbi:MAG TPA: hypothetical protein VGJ16_11855, partial [Pirellulales bacterium]
MQPARVFAAILDVRRSITLALTCCAVFAANACAQERVWREDAIGMETTFNTLEDFKFEGLPLGCSLRQFLRQFPAAQTDRGPAAQTNRGDELDGKAGLTCYTVEKLNSADRAQFFFFDGRLYQIEIEYGAKRIDAQGGMEVLVRKLVSLFGNADNAYGNRRTWHQPTCTRR